MVRQGAERAEISAEFELAGRPAARRWLAENDLAGDEDACLMRRVIESGGRSRGYINGRPATLAQLRELGELLVDIHGQHEHQSLARAGGAARAARRLRRARGRGRGRWRSSTARGSERRAGAHRVRDQRRGLSPPSASELEWQVRELEALELSGGRMAGADRRSTRRLAHAASLIEAAQFGSRGPVGGRELPASRS